MTEAELIKKIRGLRQIKPRKEWVFLTKNQILGLEKNRERVAIISFFPRYRLVLAPVLAVFLLIGIFALSQNSLPGDLLYPIKKLTEKSQTIFVSDENKTKAQLEQANRRLEELNKIAEQNQVKKIAPAIDEFQKTLSQATQNLKETPKLNKAIIDQTKKIVENKEKIEKLGVVIGDTEELENALRELVEREIKDLENKTLTEEKAKLFEEAKESFETGNYYQSLEKIWQLSQ